MGEPCQNHRRWTRGSAKAGSVPSRDFLWIELDIHPEELGDGVHGGEVVLADEAFDGRSERREPLLQVERGFEEAGDHRTELAARLFGALCEPVPEALGNAS